MSTMQRRARVLRDNVTGFFPAIEQATKAGKAEYDRMQAWFDETKGRKMDVILAQVEKVWQDVRVRQAVLSVKRG